LSRMDYVDPLFHGFGHPICFRQILETISSKSMEVAINFDL
jgi:hypothetical protein